MPACCQWLWLVLAFAWLPMGLARAAEHAVILAYHHVGDDTPASTSVTVETFAGHLAYLHRHGFTVLPLQQLLEKLSNQEQVPEKSVAITFDDAYDDIALQAAPLLAQFGFPFTVFISTDFVDRKQKGYMTWDQLRALHKQGATLANHSQSHLHLLRQPPEQNDKQWLATLRAELDGAEQRIADETGERWRYFAFPYGEADEGLVKAVKQWGYLGFGQQSGAVDRRLLQSGMVPRFPFNQMYQALEDFRLKASSLPLPLIDEQAPGTVFAKALIPELELTLAPHQGKLTCFASGQGAIQVINLGQAEGKVRYRVLANRPIEVGRSRYNCTLPVAGEPGRFHWYSHLWIRKQDDGSWYPEP